MPSIEDPEHARERRKREAKDRVAAMTADERATRIAELSPEKVRRVKYSSLPTSFDDPVRGLVGSFDLVYAVHFIEHHVEGEGADWVLATGLGFPQQLRAGGWIYLKAKGRLGARARAVRVEYREGLYEHTPDEAGTHTEIPKAAVIVVDPTTWQLVDAPAHPDHQQGYRYAITNESDGTISHIVGGVVAETLAVRLLD